MFPSNSFQEFESLNPTEPLEDLGVKNVSTMPAPKELVHSSSSGMPAPPPRNLPPLPPKTMQPPPPPPKYTSSIPSGKSHDKNKVTGKAILDAVPVRMDS